MGALDCDETMELEKDNPYCAMKKKHLDNETLREEAEMAKIGVQVRNLLRGAGLGVLGTIDSAGRPQIRWMATTTFENFPYLYTLTSSDSRKVHDLSVHPEVTWMFTSADMKFVVNLIGQARIVLKDAETIKEIWHQITDKSRAYFLGHCESLQSQKTDASENRPRVYYLGHCVSGPGFSVLETVVERIECAFPEKEKIIALDLKWVQLAEKADLPVSTPKS